MENTPTATAPRPSLTRDELFAEIDKVVDRAIAKHTTAPAKPARPAALATLSQFVEGLDKPLGRGQVIDVAPDGSYRLASLEAEIARFEAETRVEMVIVTAPHLAGLAIEEYAKRLYREWHIGGKRAENGVMIVIQPGERLAHIQVGYGMEPYLSPERAKTIIEKEIMPHAAADHFYLGLDAGAKAIQTAIRNSSYVPGSVRPRPTAEPALTRDVRWALYVVLAASLYLAAFLGRTRSPAFSASWGVIAGAALGWDAGGATGAAAGGVAGCALGLLLGALLAGAYRAQASLGMPTAWFPSRGGFLGARRLDLGGSGGRGTRVGKGRRT